MKKRLSYCLKYGKNTESKNPKNWKDKKRRNIAFIKICSVVVKNQNLSKSKKLAG